MNDKKQIEELANKLYSLQDEYDMSNPYEVAKAVLSLDYENIPEGSVVLTEERHTALKLIEKYHIKSCGKNSVVLTAEELEEARKQAVKEFIQAILKDTNISYYNDDVTTFSYVDIDDIYYIAIDKFGVEL